ncbi:MAG: hypothetical protein J0L52_06430 [Caulobacterales bacterium]|nr:hypothetical protein [Caulobacterales bacterium]
MRVEPSLGHAVEADRLDLALVVSLLILSACAAPSALASRPGDTLPDGTVVVAVRPNAAGSNATTWSGVCDGEAFSLTWSWPPDTVRFEGGDGARTYGGDEPFLRAMFVPAAPLMIYATCVESNGEINIGVLSVRRDPADDIQIARGEMVFSRRGELVAFYGPYVTDVLSLSVADRIPE